MKHLAVILALIIGTPSIADAGELDGIYLKCPSIQPPNQKTPLYLRFHNGQTQYIQIKGDQAYYEKFGSAYELKGVHKITFFMWNNFDGKPFIRKYAYISIDRTTLKISEGGECSISSKEQAHSEIHGYISQAKKKNKL